MTLLVIHQRSDTRIISITGRRSAGGKKRWTIKITTTKLARINRGS
jgi:hypothetical protein